jgi:hypothetical protein
LQGLHLAFALGFLELSIGGCSFLLDFAWVARLLSLLLFDGFAFPSSRHDVILPCLEWGSLKF